MTTEFGRDLATSRADLVSARDQLLALVRSLSDADLARGRRGHWTVAAVLEHVLQSDWHYARLIHQLREKPFSPPPGVGAQPALISDALDALTTSRDAILAAADGVDEDTFYRLGGGRQQYSVLSTLENVALHDREHREQIEEALLRTTVPES
jgi:uncharacterized damage-inducible protein DinB